MVIKKCKIWNVKRILTIFQEWWIEQIELYICLMSGN